MKACVLKGIGQLCYEEVTTPTPRKGEVLLQIKRCGICSSDIDRVFKTGTYHFPTIPGHEFSGQIIALGDGVDPSYLGRRAVVFPLLPCFRCPSCEMEEYARCDNYNYFGSRCDGAFAEYLAVPVWNLVLLADTLSYDAAALCEPAAVAFHAVNTGQITPGDTVAVVGSGTIGLLAAMWAKIQGAGQVIVIGRGEKKLKTAQTLGFSQTISTVAQDAEKETLTLTGQQGADIVLEMVGSPESVNSAICCVKKGGTVVLTGNPSGDITLNRTAYWKILRKELNIKGTWNSSYSTNKNDWANAVDYMEKGLLPTEQLITHHFRLDECDKAFRVLLDRESGAIKVMFDINN